MDQPELPSGARDARLQIQTENFITVEKVNVGAFVHVNGSHCMITQKGMCEPRPDLQDLRFYLCKWYGPFPWNPGN